ncbi:RND family transporter [Marinimicrobium sp. ABcell2]|uniref:efflux RND transporter permease subunit n=1 Tax=Marinimicrobium sp. ABcell2 TaxID=3069751 RepID=UPI0027B85D9E|nr:efflux RND transporter permease subunit [Marinimicrobium sp. ABcell2]MDQ2078001.1 efflux RND transporter permease subunit [Marinimicrobium sp. ABcell2]
MKGFIHGWARFVTQWRWLVIALFALAAGLSFIPMNNLYYDNSNESYFVTGDPNLDNFNELLDLFGDVEYLSIGVVAPDGHPDVFTPETIAVVEELTRFLESRPEITQVRSLTKYQYTHSDGAMLATDDLIEFIDDSQSLAEARNTILGEPMALGSLITEDLRHTRVVGRIRYEVGSSDKKMSLMGALREHIAQHEYEAQGYPLYLSGQPVFTEQFEVLTKRDQSWIHPTMAALMILILFISFRSLTGMLLPWAVIGTGIVLVTGMQGLLGWPHSVVSSALVPTLIIIGVGISIHVLVEFYHFRTQGQTPQLAAQSAVEHLWVPAFYTALTTAGGFAALGVTELVPVRHFAWLGSIGALTLFLVAMTLMPALLSFITAFSPRTQHAVDTGRIARLTKQLPDFTRRHRRPITLIGVLFLAGSLILIPRLEVDSNFITYFKESNPTRSDLTYFDDVYNGIQNIDLLIDSGAEGGIHRPEFLQEVAELQSWLQAQPEAGRINSLIDFHREINQALHYDDPSMYLLPDSRELAAQFLLLYDNTGPEEDLTDAKDFYERYLRVTAPITNMAASDTSAFLERLQGYIQSEHPDLSVELTGSVVMYHAQDVYINQGMFRSFMIALLIIGVSFVVLFRSVKYGLVALIPSVVPILMTGSLLVLLDVPLNLGTMIVGAMTMGIAVDDAIHVLNRYLRAKRTGESTHDAITRAMTEAGRAVIFTSIILVSGFSVMLLGSFIPYIYTGLFAATIMALALVGDLIALPALLYWLDGEKEPDSEVSQQFSASEASHS